MGSDYTSPFHRKGKVKPFAQLVKDTDAQKAFSNMTRGSLTDEDRDTLKKLTAQMYSAKGKVMSLNGHRCKVFEKTYGLKVKSHNALAKLKGIYGSMIPTCESEISQRIKR